MVDALDERGYAPIHYAAACGLVEQVRELLSLGALVRTQDRMGNTAIHWAVAFNQFQIVAMLLTQSDKNMNPVNTCNLLGRTPLHWACAIGNLQLATLLVEAGGALVNVMDQDGASPLHAATAVGHVGVVKYLLGHGAFLCSEDEVGDTPLHWAIREGHDNVVAALLESQSVSQFASPVSTEQPYIYTHTGLFVSTQGITLLPIQAHPNEDGETPLHLAACTASAAIVSRLLRNGAPPNLR
jgi:ankyrin repeat protein